MPTTGAIDHVTGHGGAVVTQLHRRDGVRRGITPRESLGVREEGGVKMANLLLELGLAFVSSVVRGFAGALFIIISIEGLKALRKEILRWQR